jgi:hypothetical protein
MQATLETAQLLHKEHGLPEDRILTTAEELRRKGSYMKLCHRNGAAQYTLGSAPVPAELRPPPELTRRL